MMCKWLCQLSLLQLRMDLRLGLRCLQKTARASACDKESGGGDEEGEGSGFGGGDGGGGVAEVGVGLAEIVEDVGEVGEVDGGLSVKVSGGPCGGGLAEVVEDDGEVGEADGAVDVGITEEFGTNKNGVKIDGESAESCEGGSLSAVIEDGNTGSCRKCGAENAGGVGFTIVGLSLEGGKDGGLGEGGSFDDGFVVGEIEGAAG